MGKNYIGVYMQFLFLSSAQCHAVVDAVISPILPWVGRNTQTRTRTHLKTLTLIFILRTYQMAVMYT